MTTRPLADALTVATTTTAGVMAATDKTKLDGVQAGATANATDAELRDRALHTGTQLAVTISDLTESVQDIIGAALVAGTGVTVTYDDVANTITLAATVDNEAIDDRVAALLTAGTNVTLTYDDVANTLTIAATVSNETIDDRVAALLVAGSNVTLTYDDVANTLTIASTASGTGGHTIQDEGTSLTARTNLNFVGAGVTVTDDSVNNRTVVTIPGSTSSATQGARVYNSASLNITNNTLTTLTFDSEAYDTDGLHSTVTNTSRLTCASNGKYLIHAQVQWASAGGVRQVRLRKNGTTELSQHQAVPGTGYPFWQQCTTVADLVAGDYVEVVVYQDSGSTIQSVSTVAAGYTPAFMMHQL